MSEESTEKSFEVVTTSEEADKWYDVFGHLSTVFDAIVDNKIDDNAHLRGSFITAAGLGYLIGATIVDSRDRKGAKPYRALGIRLF